jgi:hypothetical protein
MIRGTTLDRMRQGEKWRTRRWYRYCKGKKKNREILYRFFLVDV